MLKIVKSKMVLGTNTLNQGAINVELCGKLQDSEENVDRL